MELYRRINIHNLVDIQRELFKEVEDVVVNKTKPFFGKSFTKEEMTKFPVLQTYLNKISKFPLHEIRPLKFFVSGPGVRGDLHYDHHTTSKVGLNIPIFGGDNTYLNYYETNEENVKLVMEEKKSIAQLAYYAPIDTTSLKQLAHLEFNAPYLVRTDIFHRSENLSNQYRVIVTVRWQAPRELENFDDFFHDID
jgi:hypothetical protein